MTYRKHGPFSGCSSVILSKLNPLSALLIIQAPFSVPGRSRVATCHMAPPSLCSPGSPLCSAVSLCSERAHLRSIEFTGW